MGFWTLKTENCPTLHTANDWNVYEPVSGKWFDQENVQIRKVFHFFQTEEEISRFFLLKCRQGIAVFNVRGATAFPDSGACLLPSNIQL